MGVIPPVLPIRNAGDRVGRNQKCPCGSGRKRKACCLLAAKRPVVLKVLECAACGHDHEKLVFVPIADNRVTHRAVCPVRKIEVYTTIQAKGGRAWK
jgi:hypothetical protein